MATNMDWSALSKTALVGALKTLKDIAPLEAVKAAFEAAKKHDAEQAAAAAAAAAATAAAAAGPTEERKTSGGKAPKVREFDMTKFKKRKIALHFMYFGHAYRGLAAQSVAEDTVEFQLFKALKTCCLIETTELGESDYSRSGRTDAGVSAFGQIVGIRVRSKAHVDAEGLPDAEHELDYPVLLNRVLPPDIRALGWCPVGDDFNARYKYFFPRREMNITAMQEAAQLLVGTHDFRTLCKIDAVNVSNFVREIKTADIVPQDPADTDKPTSLYCFQVTGAAFLWHQVRCMMAILFHVGRGVEKPDVITKLLAMESKPAYNMASHSPLILYASGFEYLNIRYTTHNLKFVTQHLETMWSEGEVKNSLVRTCLDGIAAMKPVDAAGKTWHDVCAENPVDRDCEYLIGAKYQSIEDRKRGMTYDQRMDTMSQAKKARREQRHPESIGTGKIGTANLPPACRPGMPGFDSASVLGTGGAAAGAAAGVPMEGIQDDGRDE